MPLERLYAQTKYQKLHSDAANKNRIVRCQNVSKMFKKLFTAVCAVIQ